MNIFLDTNIYLSFYHTAGDDLEEMKKLAVVIRKKKAKLLFPDQVWNEFRRNRERTIADAIKRITEQKLGFAFPQVSRDYPEYTQLDPRRKGLMRNRVSGCGNVHWQYGKPESTRGVTEWHVA